MGYRLVKRRRLCKDEEGKHSKMKRTEKCLPKHLLDFTSILLLTCAIALLLIAMKDPLIGMKCPLYELEHPLNEMKNALNQLK